MEGLVELASSLGFWSWLLLGLILIALETIIPGVHFLWFGLAAFVIGLMASLLGPTFPFAWQLTAFALLSVATVFLVKRLAGPAPHAHLPDINAPGSEFIGRVVTVEDPIEKGRGKVRAGDTVWLAVGEDAPRGAKVTVTGVSGTALVVTTDGPED